MSEQWNGVPERPEEDGWHWLSAYTGIDGWEARMPWCAKWCADKALWVEVFPDDEMPGEMCDWSAEAIAANHAYLGPCLLPSEHAAAVAAAERQGMERAAALLVGRHWDSAFEPWEVAERGAQMIRAASEARSDG